jgi:hypothetical protein
MSDQSEIDLEELSVPERIKAISDDVKSGKDTYKKISAHDLAKLLGIDNAWNPGDGWSFTRFVWKEPLAEYINRCDPGSEVLACLKGTVKDERFSTIEKISEKFDEMGEIDLSQLRKKEIRLIEEACAVRNLDQLDGGTVIAHSSIKGPRRHRLRFEAFIEDDGSCINLKSPYDDRDGNFTNFKDCVTDEY